jgi:hypothetical protein
MGTYVFFGNPCKREYLKCPICFSKVGCEYDREFCHANLLAFAISTGGWNGDTVCAYYDCDDLPWEEANSGWTDVTLKNMRYIDDLSDKHKALIEKIKDEEE